MTVGELSKWAQVRAWGEVRQARLDAWIAARPVIPYDREIARVPLVTLNRKDFADFATHEGLILLNHDGA